MLVVARLDEPLLHRVVAAATLKPARGTTRDPSSDWRVHAVASFAALPVAVAQMGPDAIVVDILSRDGSVCLDAVLAIRAEFPNVPMLVYTALRAQLMAAMVPLGRAGVVECIVRDFEDAPTVLRRRIAEHGASVAGREIIQGVEAALARTGAPTLVVDALRALFASPTRLSSARALARQARLTPQRLNRWLKRSDLASARVMVDAAAAVRGYQYAQNTSGTLDVVARRLGYSAPRVFSRQLRELTGHTLSSWRHLDVAGCVAILRGRLAVRPSTRRPASNRPVLPARIPHVVGNRIPPLQH
jgi:AraC-like DNA-binding protein